MGHTARADSHRAVCRPPANKVWEGSVVIHAYALMENHHLIVQTPEANFSWAMQ